MLLLAVPSCFNSFWHGVIPTSYFIFNDFYTCSCIKLATHTNIIYVKIVTRLCSLNPLEDIVSSEVRVDIGISCSTAISLEHTCRYIMIAPVFTEAKALVTIAQFYVHYEQHMAHTPIEDRVNVALTQNC